MLDDGHHNIARRMPTAINNLVPFQRSLLNYDFYWASSLSPQSCPVPKKFSKVTYNV